MASEGAFLFRAVRNESLNALRSRRSASRRLDPPLFDTPAEDPRDAAEVAESGRQVETVLRDIPVEEREAVILKIWSDLSFPEAAEVAGTSEKTFEHRYYRGLAVLKKKLGGSHD